METFVIARDDLASSLRISPIWMPCGFRVLAKINKSTVDVMQNDNGYYSIHRLVGISNGFRDKFFIGWSVSKYGGVDCFGCVYSNEAQMEHLLTHVEPGSVCEFWCEFRQSGDYFFGSDNGSRITRAHDRIHEFSPWMFGFKLYPRLHDGIVAPSDLVFDLQWI